MQREEAREIIAAEVTKQVSTIKTKYENVIAALEADNNALRERIQRHVGDTTGQGSVRAKPKLSSEELAPYLHLKLETISLGAIVEHDAKLAGVDINDDEVYKAYIGKENASAKRLVDAANE